MARMRQVDSKMSSARILNQKLLLIQMLTMSNLDSDADNDLLISLGPNSATAIKVYTESPAARSSGIAASPLTRRQKARAVTRTQM